MGILRVSDKPQKKANDCHSTTSPSAHHLDRCSLRMSTRSRRKSGLTSKTESESLTAAKVKGRSHATRTTNTDDMDVEPHSVNGKGNSKSYGIKQGKRDKLKKPKLLDVDCVCSKGNDGSPMVFCASCRIWYVPVFFHPFAFHAGLYLTPIL
jgi:hypothetical protein